MPAASGVLAAPGETSMNAPPQPPGGALVERMRSGMMALLTRPGAAARFGYQETGGAMADREAGAALLARLGLASAPDQIVITCGGQNALQAIVHAELRPGDTVCLAPHAYPGFLALARRYGLKLRPVAMDGEGLLPEALEEAARGAKALYVVPTNDNPTAVTMGAARRRAIAAVAERHGLLLIEDDAYGLLPGAALPPVTSFLPDRGCYIASLSKSISPVLRTAYLRAPSVKAAWRMASEVHASAVMAPPLNVALASHWIGSGELAAMIAQTRAECIARQAIVAQALQGVRYAAHPEGFHLWLPLPDGRSPSGIIEGMRHTGLPMASSETFAVDPQAGGQALRLSIGGATSREQVERGLMKLEALLEHGPAMI